MRRSDTTPSWLVALALAALLGSLAVPAAADLRCGEDLIGEGDSKARVLLACGEPFLQEVVAIERQVAGGQVIVTAPTEEWSYRNPASRDPRVLRFESGRVVGKGFRCADGLVSAGDRKAEVLGACGTPLVRETVALESDAPAAPDVASVVRTVEEWTYLRGEGELMSIVVFREGRVVRVEQGGRQRR